MRTQENVFSVVKIQQFFVLFCFVYNILFTNELEENLFQKGQHYKLKKYTKLKYRNCVKKNCLCKHIDTFYKHRERMMIIKYETKMYSC